MDYLFLIHFTKNIGKLTQMKKKLIDLIKLNDFDQIKNRSKYISNSRYK